MPVVALAAALGGAGCQRDSARPQEVVAYTSVDQVFSEPAFRLCEAQQGLRVRAVFDTEETKSTGILNRLLAESDHSQADVFWSGDPVRPFLLVSRDLVERYSSPAAAGLPETLRAADGTWTGFAARARVLLVNTELVGDAERPTSLRDLADPRWRGRVAIANPLYGTTTMHIAALVVVWGEDRARQFLDELRENQVRIASSNGEVKRLVVAGEVALGLTDSDDAYQALQAGEPVAAIYPDQDDLGTLVMPTAVVLLHGAPRSAAGRSLIDCLLSPEIESHLAQAGAHMPLRAGVATPPGITALEDLRPMIVEYREVAEAMEKIQPWLREWVGL